MGLNSRIIFAKISIHFCKNFYFSLLAISVAAATSLRTTVSPSAGFLAAVVGFSKLSLAPLFEEINSLNYSNLSTIVKSLFYLVG